MLIKYSLSYEIMSGFVKVDGKVILQIFAFIKGENHDTTIWSFYSKLKDSVQFLVAFQKL